MPLPSDYEREPDDAGEQSLSALVLGGITFVVGNTKKGQIYLSIQGETSDKIYMSTTEALMLSLAFQQAVEDLDNE
jgi:hypothetical protein